jgi:hypothetical protein
VYVYLFSFLRYTGRQNVSLREIQTSALFKQNAENISDVFNVSFLREVRSSLVMHFIGARGVSRDSFKKVENSVRASSVFMNISDGAVSQEAINVRGEKIVILFEMMYAADPFGAL